MKTLTQVSAQNSISNDFVHDWACSTISDSHLFVSDNSFFMLGMLDDEIDVPIHCPKSFSVSHVTLLCSVNSDGNGEWIITSFPECDDDTSYSQMTKRQLYLYTSSTALLLGSIYSIGISTCSDTSFGYIPLSETTCTQSPKVVLYEAGMSTLCGVSMSITSPEVLGTQFCASTFYDMPQASPATAVAIDESLTSSVTIPASRMFMNGLYWTTSIPFGEISLRRMEPYYLLLGSADEIPIDRLPRDVSNAYGLSDEDFKLYMHAETHGLATSLLSFGTPFTPFQEIIYLEGGSVTAVQLLTGDEAVTDVLRRGIPVINKYTMKGFSNLYSEVKFRRVNFFSSLASSSLAPSDFTPNNQSTSVLIEMSNNYLQGSNYDEWKVLGQPVLPLRLHSFFTARFSVQSVTPASNFDVNYEFDYKGGAPTYSRRSTVTIKYTETETGNLTANLGLAPFYLIEQRGRTIAPTETYGRELHPAKFSIFSPIMTDFVKVEDFDAYGGVPSLSQGVGLGFGWLRLIAHLDVSTAAEVLERITVKYSCFETNSSSTAFATETHSVTSVLDFNSQIQTFELNVTTPISCSGDMVGIVLVDSVSTYTARGSWHPLWEFTRVNPWVLSPALPAVSLPSAVTDRGLAIEWPATLPPGGRRFLYGVWRCADPEHDLIIESSHASRTFTETFATYIPSESELAVASLGRSSDGASFILTPHNGEEFTPPTGVRCVAPCSRPSDPTGYQVVSRPEARTSFHIGEVVSVNCERPLETLGVPRRLWRCGLADQDSSPEALTLVWWEVIESGSDVLAQVPASTGSGCVYLCPLTAFVRNVTSMSVSQTVSDADRAIGSSLAFIPSTNPSNVEFICATGWLPSDSAIEITCQSDGYWDETALRTICIEDHLPCDKVDSSSGLPKCWSLLGSVCSNLGEGMHACTCPEGTTEELIDDKSFCQPTACSLPENAQITSGDLLAGSSAVVSCSPGFEPWDIIGTSDGVMEINASCSAVEAEGIPGLALLVTNTTSRIICQRACSNGMFGHAIINAPLESRYGGNTMLISDGFLTCDTDNGYVLDAGSMLVSITCQEESGDWSYDPGSLCVMQANTCATLPCNHAHEVCTDGVAEDGVTQQRTCSCDSNFVRTEDGNCDLDECSNGSHTCIATCTNTVGSFVCGCSSSEIGLQSSCQPPTCFNGAQDSNEAGRDCGDVCVLNACDPSPSDCSSIPGSFSVSSGDCYLPISLSLPLINVCPSYAIHFATAPELTAAFTSQTELLAVAALQLNPDVPDVRFLIQADSDSKFQSCTGSSECPLLAIGVHNLLFTAVAPDGRQDICSQTWIIDWAELPTIDRCINKAFTCPAGSQCLSNPVNKVVTCECPEGTSISVDQLVCEPANLPIQLPYVPSGAICSDTAVVCHPTMAVCEAVEGSLDEYNCNCTGIFRGDGIRCRAPSSQELLVETAVSLSSIAQTDELVSAVISLAQQGMKTSDELRFAVLPILMHASTSSTLTTRALRTLGSLFTYEQLMEVFAVKQPADSGSSTFVASMLSNSIFYTGNNSINFEVYDRIIYTVSNGFAADLGSDPLQISIGSTMELSLGVFSPTTSSNIASHLSLPPLPMSSSVSSALSSCNGPFVWALARLFPDGEQETATVQLFATGCPSTVAASLPSSSVSIKNGGDGWRELSVSNLPWSSTIQFNLSPQQAPQDSDHAWTCAFIDRSTNNPISDGCAPLRAPSANSSILEPVICACTHLTDFVLVEVQIPSPSSATFKAPSGTPFAGLSEGSLLNDGGDGIKEAPLILLVVPLVIMAAWISFALWMDYNSVETLHNGKSNEDADVVFPSSSACNYTFAHRARELIQTIQVDPFTAQDLSHSTLEIRPEIQQLTCCWDPSIRDVAQRILELTFRSRSNGNPLYWTSASTSKSIDKEPVMSVQPPSHHAVGDATSSTCCMKTNEIDVAVKSKDFYPSLNATAKIMSQRSITPINTNNLENRAHMPTIQALTSRNAVVDSAYASQSWIDKMPHVELDAWSAESISSFSSGPEFLDEFVGIERGVHSPSPSHFSRRSPSPATRSQASNSLSSAIQNQRLVSLAGGPALSRLGLSPLERMNSFYTGKSRVIRFHYTESPSRVKHNTRYDDDVEGRSVAVSPMSPSTSPFMSPQYNSPSRFFRGDVDNYPQSNSAIHDYEDFYVPADEESAVSPTMALTRLHPEPYHFANRSEFSDVNEIAVSQENSKFDGHANWPSLTFDHNNDQNCLHRAACEKENAIWFAAKVFARSSPLLWWPANPFGSHLLHALIRSCQLTIFILTISIFSTFYLTESIFTQTNPSLYLDSPGTILNVSISLDKTFLMQPWVISESDDLKMLGNLRITLGSIIAAALGLVAASFGQLVVSNLLSCTPIANPLSANSRNSLSTVIFILCIPLFVGILAFAGCLMLLGVRDLNLDVGRFPLCELVTVLFFYVIIFCILWPLLRSVFALFCRYRILRNARKGDKWIRVWMISPDMSEESFFASHFNFGRSSRVLVCEVPSVEVGWYGSKRNGEALYKMWEMNKQKK